MNACRVVSDARESVSQPVCLLVRKVEGTKAEVDTVKALGFIGRIGKGELSVWSRNNTPTFAGWSIPKAHFRKIERGAWLNIQFRLQGNPIDSRLDRYGSVGLTVLARFGSST